MCLLVTAARPLLLDVALVSLPCPPQRAAQQRDEREPRTATQTYTQARGGTTMSEPREYDGPTALPPRRMRGASRSRKSPSIRISFPARTGPRPTGSARPCLPIAVHYKHSGLAGFHSGTERSGLCAQLRCCVQEPARGTQDAHDPPPRADARPIGVHPTTAVGVHLTTAVGVHPTTAANNRALHAVCMLSRPDAAWRRDGGIQLPAVLVLTTVVPPACDG